MSSDGPPKTNDFDIFLMTAPGLEQALAAEAREKGFKAPKIEPGGVTIKGGWAEVWRANLQMRGAARVSVAIGSFRAVHLSELDKNARRFAWGAFLRKTVPVRVEATCKASKIYHSGAAAERVEKGIAAFGAPLSADADVCVRVRLENDVCTLAIDTSGDLLHRRGFKEAVGKAPMRETMAAMFLRECGYAGREPVLDPMCGSGTFVIEAAEIAMRLNPGRTRAFAFEQLATFDQTAWDAMRAAVKPIETPLRFYGSDRDAGAVRMSTENAARAGAGGITHFEQIEIGDVTAPAGPPGLVILNPPYGDRIGDKKRLQGLYGTLGRTLAAKFSGWRAGLIAADRDLARATGLPFKAEGAPVSHGGLRVMLFQTAPLP